METMILDDHLTLLDYEIHDGSTIQVVVERLMWLTIYLPDDLGHAASRHTICCYPSDSVGKLRQQVRGLRPRLGEPSLFCIGIGFLYDNDLLCAYEDLERQVVEARFTGWRWKMHWLRALATPLQPLEEDVGFRGGSGTDII